MSNCNRKCGPLISPQKTGLSQGEVHTNGCSSTQSHTHGRTSTKIKTVHKYTCPRLQCLKRSCTPLSAAVCSTGSSNMRSGSLMCSLPIHFPHPQYSNYLFLVHHMLLIVINQGNMLTFSYFKSSKQFCMSTSLSCTQWCKWKPYFIKKR